MPEILISPGYGAGWSTWNDGNPEFQKWLLTYKPVIDEVKKETKLILNRTWNMPPEEAYHPALLQLIKEAKEFFGVDYVCVLGADNLKVVEVDGPFKINEHDGYESVEYGFFNFITLD